MKFAAKEDIDAPIDHVFAHVSDFDGFQRSAIRRGIDVTRTDDLASAGIGMAWDTEFDVRGRRRAMTLTLVDYTPPTEMKFEAVSAGLNVFCKVELLALSKKRTRLRFEVDLKPQTLSARLLVQSLKLAKTNLSSRLGTRIADYAVEIADKHKRMA